MLAADVWAGNPFGRSFFFERVAAGGRGALKLGAKGPRGERDRLAAQRSSRPESGRLRAAGQPPSGLVWRPSDGHLHRIRFTFSGRERPAAGRAEHSP